MSPYPIEILDEDDDNGTMPENVERLAETVVGHRIVKAEVQARTWKNPNYDWTERGNPLVLTLDNGHEVLLADTSDCCAHTEVEAFLLHPEKVDHVIMGVGTTEGYTNWHIYADWGDVLELTVGWSCGNPFYYGYGFDITVLPALSEEVTP